MSPNDMQMITSETDRSHLVFRRLHSMHQSQDIHHMIQPLVRLSSPSDQPRRTCAALYRPIPPLLLVLQLVRIAERREVLLQIGCTVGNNELWHLAEFRILPRTHSEQCRRTARWVQIIAAFHLGILLHLSDYRCSMTWRKERERERVTIQSWFASMCDGEMRV